MRADVRKINLQWADFIYLNIKDFKIFDFKI